MHDYWYANKNILLRISITTFCNFVIDFFQMQNSFKTKQIKAFVNNTF